MEDDIRDISRRIIEHFNPRKLVLFGSVALGKSDPNSDLDFCLIEDGTPNKLEKSMQIRKIIGNSLIPIDILVFGKSEFERRKDIWGTVQYEIDKKGKVLYER